MRDLVIRPAIALDLPAIVDMGERFYATTDYGQIGPYCRESARKLGPILLENGVLLVAEVDGELVGAIGLVLAPFPFNNALKTAHEVLWWVDPEHRDGGAGVKLLRAMIPACQARGCRSIQMLHLRNSPRQAAALYERLGFVYSESSYTKVL